MLTKKGMNFLIDYVHKLTELVGPDVGLAFDCGPGLMPMDALRFAKGVEDCNVMWLEDLITGDNEGYNMANLYRDVTNNTTTNIHTGEQVYLRQNYREMIETQAVNIIGPDPADVGGIAELKFITEYANLHGIMMAPHGVFDGVFGMAALTQVSCTLPQNYIAYEYPQANPEWWYDIVDGLPEGFFKDGHVTVWDKPGIGVDFNIPKAEKYLRPEDKDFFLG
jgi:L-alanine-DL-glutamate epimerase-like enolase superfamily enzyme